MAELRPLTERIICCMDGAETEAVDGKNGEEPLASNYGIWPITAAIMRKRSCSERHLQFYVSAILEIKERSEEH